MNAQPRGRQFFFNPGPTNIPDSILRAMDRPAVDFLSDEFLAVHRACHEGVKRILKTKQHLFMYAANGHGAWEASFANLFSPGDKLLMIETGHFSQSWGGMARDLGLEFEIVKADWRVGARIADLKARLDADPRHEIKAVCVVQNETSTGLAFPVQEARRAMDQAKHPALLLVDGISSIGCFDFRMDEWSVDIAISGSQKGFMMPTGLSLSGISEKALRLSETARMPRHYWSWKEMATRPPQRFVGTTPVHMYFGLQESVRLLEEEGLDAVFLRHRRLAEATRAAVTHWGQGKGGPELYCKDPTRFSDSITAIWLPEGHDADALRKVAIDRFNLSLGGGLGPLKGRVFRIGHMGDLNEPMLLGALGTVELAMKHCRIPYQPGGVEAAIAALAEN